MIKIGPSLNQTLLAEDYRRGTNNARTYVVKQRDMGCLGGTGTMLWGVAYLII
jgi:hypothetical protein